MKPNFNYTSDVQLYVFGSAFVKLILDRIDFIKIDLVRIDFEIKLFMFSNSSKSNSDRK